MRPLKARAENSVKGLICIKKWRAGPFLSMFSRVPASPTPQKLQAPQNELLFVVFLPHFYPVWMVLKPRAKGAWTLTLWYRHGHGICC